MEFESTIFAQHHFDNIQKKNVAFSLRSLAQKAGCSPGHLSSFFSGKKKIGIESGLRVAKALSLNKYDASYFLHLIELDNIKDPELRKLFHIQYKQRYETVGTEPGKSYKEVFPLIKDCFFSAMYYDKNSFSTRAIMIGKFDVDQKQGPDRFFENFNFPLRGQVGCAVFSKNSNSSFSVFSNHDQQGYFNLKHPMNARVKVKFKGYYPSIIGLKTTFLGQPKMALTDIKYDEESVKVEAKSYSFDDKKYESYLLTLNRVE